MTKSRNLAKFPKTSAIQVPSGDTAARPDGANGYFRYNTSTSSFEGYSNGNWGAVGGAMYVSANTVSDANNISTGFFGLPVGNTTQRPANTANGYLRYNTTTNSFEGFSNGNWGSIGGSIYIGANTVSDIFNNSNGAFYVPTGNNSTRPATPNNGALRYNTANNAFEGYANNAWGSIGGGGSSGSSALTTYKYIATQGQTSFSGLDANSLSLNYTVGALIVTLNGLTLKSGTDYTATDGLTITLSVAADLSDELNIYAFTTSSIVTTADTLSVYKFVANTGQTSFTGADASGATLAYTRNAIFVTLNGSVLKDTTDFIQTSTSTLTLTAGATANDELNIYTFNPISIGSNATLTTYKYTANASQTLFAGLDSQGYALSYNPGAIFVALNGAILTETIDYTATSGNTISLVVPTAASDELVINSFGVFNVANTFSRTESNTLFMLKSGDTITGNVNMTSNGYFQVPIGTTAQRPSASNKGYIRYNTTLDTLESANGTGWANVGSGSASSGSGGVSWSATVQSSNFVAVAGSGYGVNTATGAVTVTLPAIPTVGQQINLFDYGQTFSANALNIYPNGNKVLGNTSNITVQSSGASIGLIYFDSVKGWVPYTGFSSAIIGPYSIDYLIVAGGGGGGGGPGGGGGGAGGYVSGAGVNIIPGTAFTVTVGGGGGVGLNQGASGSNSGLGSYTSIGGGGAGGSGNNSATAGLSGGSGGGGTGAGPSTSTSGGTGTAGQGNNGAPGYHYGGFHISGGGGGGASSAGTPSAGATTGYGGPGGSGSQWSNGSYYAGGGGGGLHAAGTTAGSGGIGGGGAGQTLGGPIATSGTTNTGGGGGGSGNSNPAGSGGSGIVIVRYFGIQRANGGTVSSTGGYTYHTFTSSGTFIA